MTAPIKKRVLKRWGEVKKQQVKANKRIKIENERLWEDWRMERKQQEKGPKELFLKWIMGFFLCVIVLFHAVYLLVKYMGELSLHLDVAFASVVAVVAAVVWIINKSPLAPLAAIWIVVPVTWFPLHKVLIIGSTLFVVVYFVESFRKDAQSWRTFIRYVILQVIGFGILILVNKYIS